MPLATREIHVWRASLDGPGFLCQQLEATLAPDEVTRANRFFFPRDRQQFVAARGILRQLLANYLRRSPADLEFAYQPRGKPYLLLQPSDPSITFNVSHSHGLALLAFSNFGHPPGERTQRVQEAVRILDAKRVDFEYDGEMSADVALNKELMAAYPFCRLKDTANVLIMPAFHSASISTRMLQELGGATVIGPLIVGLEKPVQIVSLGAKDSDIINMAAMASFNIGG